MGSDITVRQATIEAENLAFRIRKEAALHAFYVRELKAETCPAFRSELREMLAESEANLAGMTAKLLVACEAAEIEPATFNANVKLGKYPRT